MWNTVFPSFLIGLREGLEGGLVVSILIATLVRADARERVGAVWTGVAAAVALSLSFAAVLTFTAASLPAGGQDAFGGVLSLLAVCFVTTMVFWMRRNARALSGDLKARVTEALARGGNVLALTAFLAVGREGLETSLFLWTTAKSAGQARGPALGAGLGVLVAVVLCWGLYRRVLKINLTKFFTYTGAVLIVIAAGVFAYGLGDLQEGNIVPGYAAHAVNLHGIDAGSWYATLVAGTLNLTPVMTWLQVSGYLLYLVPTMALFVIGVRRAAAGAAAGPAAGAATEGGRAGRQAAEEAAVAARLARKAEAASAAAEQAQGRRVPRWAVYTSIVAVPAVVAAGAISALGPASDAASTAIAITEKACGTGWSSPSAGSQTFVVKNDGANTAEVYLINPTSNAVYGEDPDVTPGSTETMNVDLAGGAYVFRCSFVDGTVLNSTTYHVSGSGSAPAGVAPVTEQDMENPVYDYRGYVQQNLPALLTAAEKLDADLKAGDLAQARTDWLPAHLDYERLGAAYGTFEDFDGEINGSASGLPDGTATKDWTGFFRIEYGLWHGQSAAVLGPLGDTLVKDVKGLVKAFPGQATDPNDLPLRSHEILENALQFQLTGIEDYGSGTTLATLYANTQGTQQVLATIRDLIQQRDPALLGQIDTGIATVQQDLTALGAGACTTSCPMPDALSALTTAQRQKLDADLGQLLESLSVVPDLLEERTSA
ncbi:iron uptake transporter permease EfeU [Actinospica robiniae]|uniref:iron uptake transporter permease EfeU n=1 Tax=Actinospica robiniae TaxID=304901 RepID=UPI00040AFA38|nr:iron uptake transporter permease EfeU [Actinospica robiniae]